MAAGAMNFGDWASAAQNLTAAAALLAGGAWAYYKFVKGRTFHRRAELRLQASLFAEPEPAIHAIAEMENTGGADIPLRAKILRVGAVRSGGVDEQGRPAWGELATSPVFDDHDWIESQETIGDAVLVPLSSVADDTLALRVTCVVYELRRRHWYRHREGGGVAWTAHAIVPVTKGVENES